MEEGVRRWAVNISKWDPQTHEFSSALSLLPSHYHSSVTRYARTEPNCFLNSKFWLHNWILASVPNKIKKKNGSRFVKMEDRKRALVSRMLQYALVSDVMRIPLREIVIERTPEGKPYLDYGKLGLKFPNFNFNVSHHGDYVAIASEPVCLVGLDIVSYDIPRGETITEFIHFFASYFSSSEWNYIVNAGTSDDVLIEFYRYWSLKEAYVKAIGSGVSEELNKVEFYHTCWTDITAKVDGKLMTEWRFWLFELGERHCVSIAKGHPRSAAVSYKATLNKVDFTEDEYHQGLNLPSVDFVELGVEQLVSDLQKVV